MTCYETLRASAPATDAPMAHHFVKWWRNKFRNGYKKFSIGTDSERTDTEELIGRAASQCSAPPDLLPSEVRARLQPASSPTHSTHPSYELSYKKSPSSAPAAHPSPIPDNDDKHPRLRFEELTCDVELQHPKSSKQQPLQFSFTLYDLDGHGRMTKDDIAGIVSTIYETIGKSVTVPHYGSKTIQVRLTVVPEDKKADNQEQSRERGKHRRRKEPNLPTQVENNESEEDHRERLSPEEDVSSKSSCSENIKPVQRPISSKHSRHQRHPRREKRERKNAKKRSGSLQRRELLEIIQANMEKNHQSFQASRKPCDTPINEEEKTNKHKLRNRSHTVSEKPVNAQKMRSETHGHGYLDLASGGDSNLCRYDRYLHAVICSSARHAHTGYHQKQAHAPKPPHAYMYHNRSRSHDLPDQVTSTLQHPRVLQIILL